MISSKYITKLAAALMAIAVAFCFGAMLFSDSLTVLTMGRGVVLEYEEKLFDTSNPISIDIQMDEEKWQELLENALSETYESCDVTINGTTISNVGIRPKGNTSLTAIAENPDTDRYSFKLEFDKYVDGQTCFGLDKLVLNNNYADATNMKEAIVYDMYQYLDVDASLYNYAKVCLNGEYIGVYLALEAVEESFLLRNYGAENGGLYKPDSMNDGGGAGGRDFARPSEGKGEWRDFAPNDVSGKAPNMGEGRNPFGRGDGRGERPQMPDGDGMEMPNGERAEMPDGGGQGEMPQMPDGEARNEMPQMPDGEAGNEVPQMPDGEHTEVSNGGGQDEMLQMPNGERREKPNGGGFSRDNGGSDLNYTDDDLDSYSAIWESSINDTTEQDQKRVVTAIKNICAGNDLESYLDVDNILKYMAVHTFVVNKDSLSGNMAHNYYLYESDGKLNLLPWDYNLSFGGMEGRGGGDASSTVNFPIDTPFSGTNFFDALLANETYLAQYHAYLGQLVKEYVYGGKFEEAYTRIQNQIDDLVQTDPTAFYTYEEYTNGADMLFRVVRLRAESVFGQLSGTIPSTEEGQREDASALISADEIDLGVMGSFQKGERGGER